MDNKLSFKQFLVVNKLIESFLTSFRKRVWFEHGQGQNSEEKHILTMI